jgi:NAD-dependent dihydropyrimidine dehydrogenase PreA subunit
MIELVSPSRCTGCNICVAVCPVNVFDIVKGAPPAIARKADCQTCYLCEVYCPVDALYVAPEAEESAVIDEMDLIERGLLGSYRRAIGWTEESRDLRTSDRSFKLTGRT